MKACRVCGLEKPVEDFPMRNGSPGSTRNDCKECNRADQRRRYQERKATWRATRRDYYERNQAQIVEDRRAFRKREAARINAARRAKREANLEEVRAADRAYYAANPGVRFAHTTRVKMRRRRGKAMTREDIAYTAIVRADPCSYCTAASETCDHIEPLHTGGSVDWTNLTGACLRCNVSKRAVPLLVWMASRPTTAGMPSMPQPGGQPS